MARTPKTGRVCKPTCGVKEAARQAYIFFGASKDFRWESTMRATRI
jgi:hypothetical protein